MQESLHPLKMIIYALKSDSGIESGMEWRHNLLLNFLLFKKQSPYSCRINSSEKNTFPLTFQNIYLHLHLVDAFIQNTIQAM